MTYYNSDFGYYNDATSTLSSTTTSASNIISSDWYNGSTYYCYYFYTPYTFQAPTSVPETSEQRRVREEQESRNRQLREEQERKRQQEEAVSKEKAIKLLQETIGLDEYNKMESSGYIEVNSQKYKGHKYRIKKDGYSQIEVIKNGTVVDSLCIVPTYGHECPAEDRVLTKYLLAQFDEERLNRVSNHSRILR